MSGVDLIRDLRIATSGARRALAICERAVANVVEKTEAVALAIGQTNEARAVAFAATGEVLLTADDVAGVLHVSKATLARWRVLGTGPGYVKKQGRILYRAETIEKFVTSKERTKTREEGDVK
ncbi:helix-turn-helix domain-containing protein [Mesorhizobium sp.]|uniref:helix-turn-helix transcriptional regulator n=1 Tax=Mesorhizobium sp. TaxID=1871066 RepID=UPI00257CF695|nr:helix-turn-helix domain-containing protein [Mesorhizobium sp.]